MADAAREQLLPPRALGEEEEEEAALDELDALHEPPVRSWRDALRYARRPWLCGVSRLAVCSASLAIGLVFCFFALAWASRARHEGSERPDECAWTSYRLPSTVTPLAYNVSWGVSQAFAPPFAVSGVTDILVSVTAPAEVRCLLLHARGLRVSALRVTAAGGREVEASLRAEAADAAAERVAVVLAEPAGSGALTLSFEFSFFLSDSVIGFYPSTFVTQQNETLSLIQTKFEPSFARTAFPCFDEPALKATFALSVSGAPPEYSLLSNMPAAQSSVSAAGLRSASFPPSPPMSTYQLTLVVAPLLSQTASLPAAGGRGAPLPISAYAVDRGADAAQAGGLAFALAVAADVLGYYESTFGIPFPLPKLDLVYLPAFPVGAMEQWGLVTFTETYLASGAAGSVRAAGVVAHELAHQWFGNLATAEWWSALWLNEGFAAFWPYTSLAAPGGAAAAAGIDYASTWRAASAAAMAEDAFAASQPLTQAEEAVGSSGAFYAAFNTITYDKGAALIAAVRDAAEAASPGSFARGLRAYLDGAAYGAAQPSALFAAIGAASGLGEGLATRFQTLADKPGVPLVTARLEGGTLTLTQSRFFASAASAARAGLLAASARWHIRLRVRAGSGSAALNASVASLLSAGGLGAAPVALAYDPLVDGWLSLSDGGGGDYYRAALPVPLLQLLAPAMAAGEGPPADARAALLDDVFALGEAGTAGCYNTSFALAWAAGWAGADAAPQVAAALRARLLRLQMLMTADVAWAARGDPAAAPPDDGCVAALQAFMLRVFNVSGSYDPASVAADRASMAASLLGPMDAANASVIIGRAAEHPACRDLAWAAVERGWTQLTGWLGYRSTLASLVRGASRNFVSHEWQAGVDRFQGGAAAVEAAWPVLTGTMQRGIEWRDSNIDWQAQRPAVCAFVQAQSGVKRRGGSELTIE